ncbi:DUF4347 domain-containing protein, partial [Thalassospira sp.]|uniref:DUF4347 domain-containing protein n=1 Tax=Thalassospira sp. TaxID=1912094 RepID=UPI003AA805D0
MTRLDRLKGAKALIDVGFSQIQPMCLEPRFMFDAAGAATGAEAAQDAQAQVEAATADNASHDGSGTKSGSDLPVSNSDGDANTSAQTAENNGNDAGDNPVVIPDAIPAHSGTQTHEVALIDTSIAGYETLAAGFSGDVTVITFQSDGTLTQIADLLSSYGQFDAVHLVSHGSVGAIILGDQIIDVDNLSSQSGALADIGAHLTDAGDILLYGCNVGSDQQGMAFVDAMAGLTGADVAASNNVTGAADMGGDWDLEVSHGQIEAAVSISANAQAEFHGLLASSEKFDVDAPQSQNGATTISLNGWNFTSTTAVGLAIGNASQTGVSTYLNSDDAGDGTLIWNSQNDAGNVDTVYGFETQSGFVSLQSFDFGTVTAISNPIGTINIYSNNILVGTASIDLSADDVTIPTGLAGGGTIKYDNVYSALEVKNSYYSGHFSFEGAAYQKVDRVELAFDGTASYEIDNLFATEVVPNNAPTASNLTQTVPYTEDPGSAVALDDIVVTDVDSGDTITATLTLSNTAAGSLTTGTFGSASSGYDSNSGIWTVSGSVDDVNAALAAVAFTPAVDWDQDVTITTQIRDAANAGPANGTITLDVTAVNDAPTASNLTQTVPYTEDPGSAVALGDIVVTDVDSGD